MFVSELYGQMPGLLPPGSVAPPQPQYGFGGDIMNAHLMPGNMLSLPSGDLGGGDGTLTGGAQAARHVQQLLEQGMRGPHTSQLFGGATSGGAPQWGTQGAPILDPNVVEAPGPAPSAGPGQNQIEPGRVFGQLGGDAHQATANIQTHIDGPQESNQKDTAGRAGPSAPPAMPMPFSSPHEFQQFDDQNNSHFDNHGNPLGVSLPAQQLPYGMAGPIQPNDVFHGDSNVTGPGQAFPYQSNPFLQGQLDAGMPGMQWGTAPGGWSPQGMDYQSAFGG